MVWLCLYILLLLVIFMNIDNLPYRKEVSAFILNNKKEFIVVFSAKHLQVELKKEKQLNKQF